MWARDTHAYVPNVRDQHDWLRSALFKRALNDCVEMLPPETLAEVSRRWPEREDWITGQVPTKVL